MTCGTSLYASVIAYVLCSGTKLRIIQYSRYSAMQTTFPSTPSNFQAYIYTVYSFITFRFHFFFPGFTCRPVLCEVQLRWSSDPGHVTMFSFPSPSIFASWFRPRYLWRPDFDTDTKAPKPTGTYSCATLPLYVE